MGKSLCLQRNRVNIQTLPNFRTDSLRNPMRTDLRDQTAGTAKCRHQGTTHSHTRPLILVSRRENRGGSERYSPNPGRDLTFSSIPSNSYVVRVKDLTHRQFNFDRFDSYGRRRPKRHSLNPVRDLTKSFCGFEYQDTPKNSSGLIKWCSWDADLGFNLPGQRFPSKIIWWIAILWGIWLNPVRDLGFGFGLCYMHPSRGFFHKDWNKI